MKTAHEMTANARRLYRKAALKWGGASCVDQRRLARFVGEHAAAAHGSAAPGSPASTGAAPPAPRIGIVVPCYGHARYLPAAFASILNQTEPPEHVVFLDDCSPDDTRATLERLATPGALGEGRVTVARNDRNLGQCATINRAVELLRADVAVVLNDDDYLMHDAVERMRALCVLHPEARLFGAKAVYVYGDEYLANHRKLVTESLLSEELHVRISTPAEVRRFRSGKEIDMCHSGSAFFKDAWRAVGGYRAQWSERVIGYADRDFQIRVNALFPIAIVENAAFAFWRIDSSVDQGLFS
jgi:glycosyltransferase involved in cell wall biosynthesis